MPKLKIVMTKAKKSPKRASQNEIAKLLTLAETDLKRLSGLLSKFSKTHGLRIGITGPPGAGKSSLVSLLIDYFRAQNLRVAVLAVDPSSPFSGGAVLGDRIRMGKHFEDENVFIRSLGSRGGFGGLSAATGAMARVFETHGWDVVLIETVGVGQTEFEIMNLADCTAVVLVPESGDVIQTMKAGILEIADCFVVNKADRPGAEVLAQELKSLAELESNPKAVFQTSVPEKRGVEELAKFLLNAAKSNRSDHSRIQRRNRAELRSLILAQLDQQLTKSLKAKKTINPYTDFFKTKLPKL